MMLKNTHSLLRVWYMRPMNWLVVAGMGLLYLMAFTSHRSSQPVEVYRVPERPGNSMILTDTEQFLSQQDPLALQYQGIDFSRMSYARNSGRRRMLVADDIAQQLPRYANIQWLQLAHDQLQGIRPGMLSEFPSLRTLIVTDLKISPEELQRISEAASVEHLTIETIDLQGEMSTLASMPNLRELVITHGRLYPRDTPMKSPFRPESLQQLCTLKNLESLALSPQWLPHEVFFAGSKIPDPACDGILKQNAGRYLSEHPGLKRLWVGSQRLESERESLIQLDEKLSGVRVEPAKYDSLKIVSFLPVGLLVLFLGSLLACNLTSDFSPPGAVLIPGHNRPHFMMFLVIATFCAVSGIGVWTHMTTVALLPATATMSVVVAVLMLTQVHWNIFAAGKINTLWWLPCAMLIAPWLTYLAIRRYGSLGATLDRFGMGVYPILAVVLLSTGVIVSLWALWQYRNQHRVFAENAVPPTVAFTDFQNQQLATLSQQRTDSINDARDKIWEPHFQRLKQSITDGHRWAEISRWRFGGTGVIVVRRFAMMAALFTVGLIGVALWNREFPGQMVSMMTIAYMIGFAGALAYVAHHRDDEIVCLELLRPVSKRDFVRQRLASVMYQVSSHMLVTFLCSIVLLITIFEGVTLQQILRNGAFLVVLAVLFCGIVMRMLLTRNVFAVAIVFFVGFAISMGASVFLLDPTNLGSDDEAEMFHNMIYHPSVYPASVLTACLAIWFGYTSWMRREFGM